MLETFKGETVWEGEVSVFSVAHPDAEFVYAWAYTNDVGEARVVTVLGEGPISTPLDAVRVHVVAVGGVES